jgi:FKBP-type peptidyl-prolyl cis-trans isomerase FkpA
MKHSIYAAAAMMILLVSCSAPFKKGEMGIEYKIITSGKGDVIKAGNFFEISFDQTYKGSNKDTVLFTSADYSNQVVALDSNAIPPVYYKIFSQVRKGDSVVVKQLSDSAMKQGGTPPFMKKGASIISHYKIVNIYTDKASADSAYKAQMTLARTKDSLKSLEQLKKDDKAIADYLKSKNIQAVKAPAGTYVQIITPGEGDVMDTSKVAKVFYTGKSLEDGKPFDSNTDPQFNHPEVFPVYLGAPAGSQGSVIKGWTDGLSLLRKGSKAVFYIPSSLAYGKQGSGADIKPNANLVFDIEIADVVTLAEARAEGEVKRKQMEAEQKKRMDSLQKAAKLDTSKR